MKIQIDPNNPAFPAGDWSGLTKREYFIAAALQGILASNPNITYTGAISSAINVADDLIYELNARQ